MIWIAVAAGGALGATARHALSHVVHQRSLASTFPASIFIINVAGSFAIGLFAGLVASNRIEVSHQTRAFVMAGVLGGFTTFSSFSLDTLTLVRAGHHGQALWNVIGQVGLSLIGVWLGFALATGKIQPG